MVLHKLKSSKKLLITGILLYLSCGFFQAHSQELFNADSTEKIMISLYESGSYNDATALSFRLLFYYRNIKNKQKEAELLITLGEIYRGSHNYNSALSYVTRGLHKAIRNKDSIQISRAYNRLAAIHFEKSNEDLAIIYTDSSDNIAKRNSYTNQEISNLNLRGAISRGKNDHHSSLSYLHQALDLARDNNNIDNLISAHLNLAQLYLKTKKNELALSHTMTAIDIANANGLTSHLPYAYMVIARSHYNTGNFQKAFDYQSLHYDMDREFRNKNTKQRIDILNATLETEKKVRENVELKQQISNNNNKWVWSGLILCFAIAVFSMYLLRVQRKNSKLLAIKEDEIRNRNLELQSLIESKDKLFSILSHDLISPINHLAEALNLVTDEDLTVEEAKPVLKKLHVQTFHIRELTENVLSWARSQMGGAYIKAESSNLSSPVLATVNHVSPISEHKKIKIEIANLSNPVIANIDPEVVRFVTRNILMNAIKFTNSGKSIKVSLKLNHNYAQVIIQDEGIGIPTEKHSGLFLFKAERSYGTGKEKGTGMGLPMCYDLITKAGGKLDFESSEGSGTTFICSYPLS